MNLFECTHKKNIYNIKSITILNIIFLFFIIKFLILVKILINFGYSHQQSFTSQLVFVIIHFLEA